MTARSATSRTFTILLLLPTAIITLILLQRPLPGYESTSNEAMLTIYFSREIPYSARKTEKEITSVIENWLSGTAGIKTVVSETDSQSGSVTVYPDKDTNPEEIFAAVIRLVMLRKEELPEDVQISYNYNDPGITQAEILLTGKFLYHPDEIEKLTAYLSALDGIRDIQAGNRQGFRKFTISDPYRFWLDSAAFNHISAYEWPLRKGSLRHDRTEPSALHIGNTRIALPAAVAPSASVISGFLRFNGSEVISMVISIEVSALHELYPYIRRYPGFGSDIIIYENDVSQKGLETIAAISNICLLLLLVALSLIRRSENILNRFLAGLGIIGASLWIPLLFSTPEMAGSLHLKQTLLAGALILLFCVRLPEKGAHLNIMVSLAYILWAAWMFGMQWTLLSLPLLAVSAAYYLNRRFRITSGSRHLVFSFLHLIMISSGVLMLSIMPWEQLKELPHMHSARDDSGQVQLQANLFLMDRDQLFATDYIPNLEKELLAYLKEDDHLLIRVQDGNQAVISLKTESDPKNVYAVLVRKALRNSGIKWYITLGELSFSNTSTPIFPSMQWVLAGYNVDTLKRYTDVISEMLSSTARVKKVVTGKDEWMPSGTGLFDMETWAAPLPPADQLWSREFYNETKISIIERPVSRWRLYHQRYMYSGRYYRGYELLDSLDQDRREVIRKRNRAYLSYIGHEYSGSKKLTENFRKITKKRISSMLPSGIELVGPRDNDQAGRSDQKRVIIFTLVSLAGLLCIRAGDISRLNIAVSGLTAGIMSLTVTLCAYIYMLKEIPPDWPDHFLMLPVFFILSWNVKFDRMMLYCGWSGAIITAISLGDGNVSAGMITILTGMVTLHLVSRSPLIVPSLPRIWHGRQFSQKH